MQTQHESAKDPSARLDRLKGKRILITGGCGFVGSSIADQLVSTGCAEIVLVDNMVRGRIENIAQAARSGNVHIVQGDIRDSALMDTLIAGSDIVFHQAALHTAHCAAEPRAAFEVMAAATFDILEKCVAHKIEKVVMASTASIDGMAGEFPTAERHHSHADRTLHGACKTFGEGLLRSFNDMYRLDYVALRYFDVYGPRMDLHGKRTDALIRWMDRIVDGDPPIIVGDGLQTMDMIHVCDVARANVLAAACPASDVVLDIGSGTETSLLELAHLLTDILGRSELRPVHEAERAVNPVSCRRADVEEAARLIGFRSSIDLADGMADLVSWWAKERGQLGVAAE